MTKSNKELVFYRLQRAHETLEGARILADAWNRDHKVERLMQYTRYESRDTIYDIRDVYY